MGLTLLCQLRLDAVLQQQLFHLRPLPEAAQVIPGKGRGHLRPAGQAADILVLLGKTGEHLPQVQGLLGGADHVHRKGDGQHQRRRVHQKGGHVGQQAPYRRVDEAHHQHGEEAPGNGARKADIAVEIAPMFGIIPVAHAEQPLHDGAGHILQRRGGHQTQHIHQPQVLCRRQRDEQDQNGAGAVDGQQRPVEKATVHPAALAHGDIAALPYPAAKAIEEKQQDPLSRGVDMHSSLNSRYFWGSGRRPPGPAPGSPAPGAGPPG